MDIKKVKQLIAIFENSKLAKLDLESEELKIKMEKSESQPGTFQKVEKEIIKNDNAITTNEKEITSGDTSTKKWIKSPLVGTFYCAPAVGAEPFVKIGDYVKKGDVLCIIEAMKVMNEIKADESGYVVEIKAINGEMVEYAEEIIALGEQL